MEPFCVICERAKRASVICLPLDPRLDAYPRVNSPAARARALG